MFKYPFKSSYYLKVVTGCANFWNKKLWRRNLLWGIFQVCNWKDSTNKILFSVVGKMSLFNSSRGSPSSRWLRTCMRKISLHVLTANAFSFLPMSYSKSRKIHCKNQWYFDFNFRLKIYLLEMLIINTHICLSSLKYSLSKVWTIYLWKWNILDALKFLETKEGRRSLTTVTANFVKTA